MNLSTCRGCGERIVWMKTEKGRNIPVDPQSIDADDYAPGDLFDPDTHISHWGECPEAERFRRSH